MFLKSKKTTNLCSSFLKQNKEEIQMDLYFISWRVVSTSDASVIVFLRSWQIVVIVNQPCTVVLVVNVLFIKLMQ